MTHKSEYKQNIEQRSREIARVGYIRNNIGSKSLAEMAQDLGISRQRVFQIAEKFKVENPKSSCAARDKLNAIGREIIESTIRVIGLDATAKHYNVGYHALFNYTKVRKYNLRDKIADAHEDFAASINAIGILKTAEILAHRGAGKTIVKVLENLGYKIVRDGNKKMQVHK